ncbi:MAG TPA: PAS domain S-box protein [Ideonella sp.]|uniref:PAS domain-containing sensor histidine kinase n=1 Tax=Ideonella sp. TaxID=1929293 RepID=UPI002C5EEFDC|nr:PAS domain S-box protein [Ideonella sp.]HSI50010.1 PAS domain S-box protein [Ideonella sp.]
MPIPEDELLRLMLGHAPDALILIRPDGEVLRWAQGAEAIYGHTATDACGQRFEALVVPPDLHADHARHLDQVLAGGAGAWESVRQRRNGSLLYVDVSARRLLGGAGQPLIVVAEKDVTALRVQRDAQLMEARYRELLDSTPDGIVMANPTGHIVIANTQAERLFGYAPGELRGRVVDELLPSRYRRAHVGHRSRYFLQPRQRSMGSGLDLAGLRKDGSEFPVEISLSPLQAEGHTYVMSAIRDISERKRFEHALQEKNQELALANEAKDRFLAGMSHELRTPLNAIIGFTGTLLMKLPGPLNAEQEQQLRTVQSSGRHLLALINDLLDVAKIEAGKLELHLKPVDCGELLREIAATLAPQARAKGLDFDLQLPEEAVVLQSDRRALQQIVLNLVGNGIKFTEEGGVRMTLAAGVPAPQDSSGHWVEIRVEDSGIGIAPSDHAKLFGAFSRVNQSRPGAPDGTGLGLHLSQRLAEVLGGRIVVQSKSDHGSRFSLLLPGA